MWLDGLYMCGPFYAEYCSTFTCAGDTFISVADGITGAVAADSGNNAVAVVSNSTVGNSIVPSSSPSSLRSEDPPPKARRLVSEANSNVVPPQSPTRSSTGGATGSVSSCADCFNDVTLQYKLIARHTYDSVTGLFRHGYDESRTQAWSDPVTGCSANAWGRALGWYAMSLVDVLDFLPADHTDRDSILAILQTVADGIVRYQDISSGVWHQVLDSADAPGNYLESSCSCMFVYFLSKSVRLGYLPSSYLAPARVGYAGIIKNFLRDNADGTYSITNCCEVAGLGGSPYRDGSYSYYISEPVRDNDPKSVGPFILASLEFER
jgi:rhamnogalacturonyl hydrolase YesR